MTALMQWLDRLQLVQRPARLKQFIEEFGDDPGRRQTQKFITAFSENNDDGWNAGELITAMEAARSNYLGRLQAGVEHSHNRRLQPLNP